MLAGTSETMETKLLREGRWSEGPGVPSAQPGALLSPCWADGGGEEDAPHRGEGRPGPQNRGEQPLSGHFNLGFVSFISRTRRARPSASRPCGGPGAKAEVREGTVWQCAVAALDCGCWPLRATLGGGGTRGMQRRVPTPPSGSFPSCLQKVR